jgi:hypothetical protein
VGDQLVIERYEAKKIADAKRFSTDSLMDHAAAAETIAKIMPRTKIRFTRTDSSNLPCRNFGFGPPPGASMFGAARQSGAGGAVVSAGRRGERFGGNPACRIL